MPIYIFTSADCIYCHNLKLFLREHGVSFKERDISGNRETQKELFKKTGQKGVPVLEIGGEVVVGFDRKKISKLLAIKN